MESQRLAAAIGAGSSISPATCLALPPATAALFCFDLDEALMQPVPDADPSASCSSPSAARAAIAAMPRPSQPGVCAVCMEEYDASAEGDGEARRTPCSHSFHAACIASWLALHDSCPMCRCSIPTGRRF